MPRRAELPKWAWDLVIALQEHKAEHTNIGDSCLRKAIALIPPEIHDQAAAISAYARFTAEEATLSSMDASGLGGIVTGRSGA